MKRRGYSLVELLATLGITAALAAIVASASLRAYRNSSLAISANNLRQLAIGASNYLSENNYTFWEYRSADPDGEPGVRWWFGFEPLASFSRPEGQREFDPDRGPLAGYVPSGIRPDPSLVSGGRAFKPKYQFGYIGVGYNALLGGGAMGKNQPASYWTLPRPSKIVVFATSAQVNTFQRPATPKNPMLEEFYLLDDKEVTVHFRHNGLAMVAFADGSAGFLPMDESTRDPRAPKANVGRFAPVGSTQYLKP
jgi:prepilin-type N-terminal cleavage/methylation domain-containing protein/prepilin-type processing-associated H-X9-DG protein